MIDYDCFCDILLIVPFGIETSSDSLTIHSLCSFNRTIWNWNFEIPAAALSFSALLIVPFGIETFVPKSFVRPVWYLLIVPFGIETAYAYSSGTLSDSFNRTIWNWNHSSISDSISNLILLIVPFGIETRLPSCTRRSTFQLLIVPFGIETGTGRPPPWRRSSFNRTIWNWNLTGLVEFSFTDWSFNRTIWNWNEILRPDRDKRRAPFNRTIWNWNEKAEVAYIRVRAFNRTIWNWNAEENILHWFCAPFNRTIWNWNYSLQSFSSSLLAFNRTIWNWNERNARTIPVVSELLIVPFGIETSRLW